MLGALFIVFVPEYASDVDEALAGVIYGAVLIVFMYLRARRAGGHRAADRTAPSGWWAVRMRTDNHRRRSEEHAEVTSDGALALLATALALVAAGADATRRRATAPSAPGVTDDTIKLGGSYPFSGPASAYGTIGRAAKAHFAMVNAKGGVNGRKIEFVTVDDGYEPARAVSNARRLITQDKVFALFNTLGTAEQPGDLGLRQPAEGPARSTSPRARRSGARTSPSTRRRSAGSPTTSRRPRPTPTTSRRRSPTRRSRSSTRTTASARTCCRGFEKAHRGQPDQVVARESYEVTDPTVAPQVAKLARSGADTFLNIATPKPAAQAIGTVAKSGWKPLHILNNVAASKTLVLKPVGFEAAQGIVSMSYFKDPEDPQWADDAAMREYKTQLKKYGPRLNPEEPFNAYGWASAATMVKALEEMGDEPDAREAHGGRARHGRRDRAAAAGHPIKTGEGDGYPIQSVQIMRFRDENWQLQGEVLDSTEQ